MQIPHSPVLEDRPGAVIDWRERLLLRAGVDLALAQATARDPRSDLHALLELVDRGCPPALAARIVAPLEAEGGAFR